MLNRKPMISHKEFMRFAIPDETNFVLYGACKECHKGFMESYSTKRSVKRAYAHAQKKVPLCCPNAGYTIGWVSDSAKEEIVKQPKGIVNQSNGIVNQ
jgi:hypothetical protein